MKFPRITPVSLIAVIGLIGSLALSAPASGLAGLIPTGAKGGGYFQTTPATPAEGQSIKLAGMFASSTKGKTITFYRQAPAADPNGDFVAFATRTANSSGNGYIDGYVVNGDQNWFARVDGANETEVDLISPVEPPPPGTGTPSGPKGGGYFTTSPAAPLEEGQSITLGGMFASSTKGKTITFYRQAPAADPAGDFVEFATRTANSSGNAYVDGYVVNGDQNWFARVDSANETEVEAITPVIPPPPNSDGVVNPITGSGKTITATFDPVTPGAVTKLEIQRTPTAETDEVNSTNPEEPDDSSLGPWLQIETGVQDASGNTTFNLPSPYPYRVAHNYRARSVSTTTPPVSFGLPQVTPKTSGLSAVYFNTNEGHAVDTRSRYFEGEFSMTASSNLPECTAVSTNKNSTMKGRGNYSWSFNRKSFTLKLGAKINLCGMGSSKKWALVANDYDKSLMRNSLAGYIGSKMTNLAWTPKSRPVDLYLNGSYRGNYLLIERVSIQTPEKLGDPDPNKRVTARMNLPELKGGEKTCPVGGPKTSDNQTGDANHPNNLDPCKTGGYILEWDFRKGGDYNANLGSDSGYVGVKDPENDLDRAGDVTTKGISTTQKNYIRDYLNTVDSTLRGSGFTNDTTGWKKYIDEASAVDYYIAMEYMKPVDGNMWASVYMYKQRDSAAGAGDGKLFFGPLWDFDLSSGSAKRAGNVVSSSGFYLKSNVSSGAQQSSKTWFHRLNEDSDFRAAVQARWNDVKADIDTTAFLNNQKSIIDTSADQTYASFGHSYRISTVQQIKSNFDADFTYLRSWAANRESWLNSSSGFN